MNAEVQQLAERESIPYRIAYDRFRYQRDKEKRLKVVHRWYAKNREDVLAKLRARTAANPKPRGKRPYESIYNGLLKTLRERAKRNPNFPASSLTYEELVTFTTIEECHYCGEQVKWTRRNTAKNGRACNLDRKDNALGYSVENCVVCCLRCNVMKSDDIPYEVFCEIGKVLKSWKQCHTSSPSSKPTSSTSSS